MGRSKLVAICHIMFHLNVILWATELNAKMALAMVSILNLFFLHNLLRKLDQELIAKTWHLNSGNFLYFPSFTLAHKFIEYDTCEEIEMINSSETFFVRHPRQQEKCQKLESFSFRKCLHVLLLVPNRLSTFVFSYYSIWRPKLNLWYVFLLVFLFFPSFRHQPKKWKQRRKRGSPTLPIINQK